MYTVKSWFMATVALFTLLVSESKSSAIAQNPTSAESHRVTAEWFEDEDGNGLPDLFPDFGSDINLDLPDWLDIDWDDFDWDHFDWRNRTWNNGEWADFLHGLWGEDGFGQPIQDLDVTVCSILETAVGIGQSFGLAGGCYCDGSPNEDLTIQCSFLECVDDSTTTCGNLALELDLTDATATVSTSACVDLANDSYEEVCFSYELDMTHTQLEQTCNATYGGNPCECSIQDFCLMLDCSAYLPGAKMDTCQHLALDKEEDAGLFVPRFPIFEEGFSGFSFGDIDWTNLNWDLLDWKNFNFDMVDWTGVDWEKITWGSLFGNDASDAGVCIALGRALAMDGAIANGCYCEGEDDDDELTMTCPIDEVCTSDSLLCGNISLGFNFLTVDGIGGSFCVEFVDDVHPTTCLNYTIPVADKETSPTCHATYGGNECTCTISDDTCVLIDCSEFEPSAVMDTCQKLELNETESIVNYVPAFAIPSTDAPEPEVEVEIEDGLETETGDVDVEVEKPKATKTPTSIVSEVTSDLDANSDLDDSGTHRLGIASTRIALLAAAILYA